MAGGGRAPGAWPSSRTQWQKCYPGGPVHPAWLHGRDTTATDVGVDQREDMAPILLWDYHRVGQPSLPKALAETGSMSCQKERHDKCSAYLLDRFSFANKV